MASEYWSMLETIVKVNFALYALICFEAVVLSWLQPRDRSSTLLQEHPRARYLIPVAGVICLIMVFVPDNHPGSSSLMRSKQLALLTPVTVILTVLITAATVKSVWQRVRKGGHKSELERARLDRLKARHTRLN